MVPGAPSGTLCAVSDRRIADLARWLPWVARLAWLLVAIVGGSAIDAAVDGRSDAVRWTAAIGGWTLWGVVAAALAIESVRSLTIARIGTPLALVATVAAAIAGAPLVELVALGLPAFAATAAVSAAELGRRFVQASAYGDEERFPLRAPVAAGAAAVTAWVVWALCLLSGPLLVAARSWIAGIVLSALAVAGTWFLVPRWHRLTQRWLVFVPAGLVVRDPVVLADTVMLRTAQVGELRLARAGTEAADLTGPASGYVVEVTTHESVTAVYAFTPAHPNGRAIHMTSFLVCPSRPGEALRVAAQRGLPVS